MNHNLWWLYKYKNNAIGKAETRLFFLDIYTAYSIDGKTGKTFNLKGDRRANPKKTQYNMILNQEFKNIYQMDSNF